MKALTPVDQLFLWLEKRQQPMHVAGLHVYSMPEDVDERTYVAELAAMMREHHNVCYPLNQTLVSKWGRLYWNDDLQLDLEHHLQHRALPAPGRIRELLSLVSAEHSHLMDRERPLWQCHLVEGLSDRRFAMYIKVHHSLVDGVSSMRMAQRSWSTDPAERDMPPFWACPVPRRAPSEAPALDVMGSLHQLFHGISDQVSTIPGVARELFRTVQRERKNARYDSIFHAPQSILNQKITGSRRFAAQSYSLSRIKAIAKATHSTVNDIVLAMCSGALREYLLSRNALPDKPLIAMVPMSLRQDDSVGGNSVGMILASLATHIDEAERRLRSIKDSVSRSKAQFAAMTPAEILNYTALTLAPAGIHLLSGIAPGWQTFNVVISNVPGPRETMYWNGARLEGMYPVSIVLDQMALNLTLVSYEDQVEFGVIGCRRTLPSLQRILDYLDTQLNELEQVAGIVPQRKKTKRRPSSV